MRRRGAHPPDGTVRIVTGTLGGQVIRFDGHRPDLRPTLGRVREAVFNILAPYKGSHGFVDLCAGSGAMGFEAHSSGFAPVLMFDADLNTVRNLKENAARLKADVAVHKGEAEIVPKLLTRQGAYVFYADPPYRDARFHARVLPLLACSESIARDSLYVAEQDTPIPPELPHSLSLLKQKKYGRVHLFFIVKV